MGYAGAMPDTGPPYPIALEGASNLRDLGGYRTADGRVVRRGRVFRSAALAKLTPAARILMRTWPAFSGAGSTSSSRRSSGPPQWRQIIAFMCIPYALTTTTTRDAPLRGASQGEV